MSVRQPVLWSVPLSIPLVLLSSLGTRAIAAQIEMKVLPMNGPGVGCPESLIAYETTRPPAPGGYATDGMVQLSAIATNITATSSDDFSATWIGTLKPEYRTCTATAGIYSKDGERYWGHSYLRTQLADGQVKVVLDMTGTADANGFTSTLIEQTMREGNPRWTWGGTD